MKTLKKYSFFILLTIFTTLLIVSCNNNSSTNSEDNQSDSLATDSDSVSEQMPEVVYQVPAPDELFGLIKNSGCKYRDDILSPEKSNFEAKASQELNLGVYAADLAYLAAFDKFQQSLKYFSKVKSMSDQLGLSTAIGSEMYDRLEKNMSNSDSLLDITNNSYYNVIQKLEESGNGKTLSMIITGGWIESMYIAVNLVDKFNESDKNIQRIASQKIIFNNLMQNLEKYNKEEEISTQINNFSTLKTILENIKKETIENDTKVNSTKVIVGQKSKYTITKETFESFKSEITKLRNQIIKMS